MKKSSKIFVIVLIFIFIIIFKQNKVLGVSEIPRVYFDGNISNMLEKTDEREIKITFISKDVNFDCYAKLKIQGTSSIYYDKKNYNIDLYKDNEYQEKFKIDVGKEWGKQNKYCLKANWIDKTHARNIVSARITAKIQKKYGVFENTPNYGVIDGFPVEIYSNNEFLGLYTWNIPKADWLWNLDEDKENNLAFEGKFWTESVAFREQIEDISESGWEITVGEENQENIDKFNRVIKFVSTSTDEKFVKNFESYINKDAMLNYIIMVYAMEGIDNLGKNLIMVTYDGLIWYPSLYDMDCTWGTYVEGNLAQNYDHLPEYEGNELINRVISNFKQDIKNRWFELRKNILTRKGILDEFDKFINSIPQETYEREKEKYKDIPGYGINQISLFVDYRLKYVDEIISGKRKNIRKAFIYFSIIIFIILLIALTIKKHKTKKKVVNRKQGM